MRQSSATKRPNPVAAVSPTLIFIASIVCTFTMFQHEDTSLQFRLVRQMPSPCWARWVEGLDSNVSFTKQACCNTSDELYAPGFDGNFCPYTYRFRETLPLHLAHCGASYQDDILDFASFLDSLRGRTLMISGDSVSSMFCRDLLHNLDPFLQISSSAPGGERLNTSYDGNPFRWNRALFGCDVYAEYEAIICCVWAFESPLSWNTNWSPFKKALSPDDIFLWNTGVHYPIQDDKGLQQLATDVKSGYHGWRALQKPFALFWRETAAQHFNNPSGNFNNTSTTRLLGDDTCQDIMQHINSSSRGPYNDVTTKLMREWKVPVLDIYDISKPLFEAHYNPGLDCTHFCSGTQGPYRHEMKRLAHMLRDYSSVTSRTLPRVSLQSRWDKLMESNSSLMASLHCANRKIKLAGYELEDRIPHAFKLCACKSAPEHLGNLCAR